MEEKVSLTPVDSDTVVPEKFDTAYVFYFDPDPPDRELTSDDFAAKFEELEYHSEWTRRLLSELLSNTPETSPIKNVYQVKIDDIDYPITTLLTFLLDRRTLPHLEGEMDRVLESPEELHKSTRKRLDEIDQIKNRDERALRLRLLMSLEHFVGVANETDDSDGRPAIASGE